MTTAASTSTLQGSVPFTLPALALTSSEAGEAVVPDWVMLFPAGITETNDGRLYKNTDPDSAIARTEAVGLFVPADVSHGMEWGSPEPSMGWVEEYDVRDGAIWGRVEWTDLGRAAITAKHYRYISPAFDVDNDGNLIRFRTIALVNTPAFTMPALASQKKHAGVDPAHTPQHTETMMDEETLAKFRKIFNLPDDADGAAVQAAIDAAAQAVGSDDSKGDDGPGGDDDAVELPENPDPEHFVHKVDYDAAIAALSERADELAKAPSSDDVEAAITQAVTAGRIAPSTADYHRAMCATQKGFDQFKDMVRISPKIVPTTPAKTALASVEKGNHGLTPNQLKTCSAMGIEPKAYAATRQSNE